MNTGRFDIVLPEIDRMVWWSFDLETRVAQWILDKYSASPEDSELIPKPSYGNTKKPEGREAIRKNWYENQLYLEAMNKSPMHAEPVCACFYNGEMEITLKIDYANPLQLQREIWAVLLGNGPKDPILPIITAYGKGYDIPIMLNQSIAHDGLGTEGDGYVDYTNMRRYLKKDWDGTDQHHVDLCERFPESKAKGHSLNFLASMFLGAQKLRKGSDVPILLKQGEKGLQLVCEYCLEDVRLTYAIGKKARLI